ncbi:MAG TPA: hypothetical protein EYG48_06450 [Methylococcales bacterium]|uniref:hypothetical protein n=1 Tax=Methyloprofundus sp. TaxID=2020875 RepID=UPI001A169B13|nr:hypothetical protein [Methyloprofundus sp.]HIL78530.1 hypothetical protein [Methylococcales bacterium]
MSCHAGGGWAEKDRDGIRYDEKDPADIKPLDGDYYNRMTMPNGQSHVMLWDWKKSGVGEADCMFCHVDFDTLKTPEDSGLEVMLSPRKARQAFTTEGFFCQAASGLLENVVDKDGKNLMTVARAIQPNPGMLMHLMKMAEQRSRCYAFQLIKTAWSVIQPVTLVVVSMVLVNQPRQL